MTFSRLIRHRFGSYEVRVAPGLAAAIPAEVERLADGGSCFVIADETVARLHSGTVAGLPVLTFQPGESSKNRENWAALTDRLIDAGADRSSLLISFGGGVASDLAGFVAATFMRGIRWAAAPTSTLAMVDASVGGKTGVDTPAGKNLVGAFHPPVAVWCDPELLLTLPGRNFREGLVEAIKHAAIASSEYWDWLDGNADGIAARDPALLGELVARSVAIKADVVESDEMETGRRAVLNVGHTVGHAIEQVTGYGIPHGEAVAIGLVEETRLAESLGVAERGTAGRLERMLRRFGMPTEWPAGIDRIAVADAMKLDKKNAAGTVRAALLAGIGTAALDRQSGRWTFPFPWPASPPHR